MRKSLLIAFSIVLIVSGLLLIFQNNWSRKQILSPVTDGLQEKVLPLARYSIENLRTETIRPQELLITEKLSQFPSSESYLTYLTDKESSVSGLLNIPRNQKARGIIFLLRGYVPREIFASGIGTGRIGEKLAANGYVTLAPDFLGYGKSSNPSSLPLEERFQTYTTVLSYFASADNIASAIRTAFPEIYSNLVAENIGLFGHSNGGHIALAALEITGAKYPTVLWAPVSKPFPYSVLAYTDEADDKGKALRKLIADFETDYDAGKYSIDNYFDLINAPISVHQGINDVEVPYWWSDEFVDILNSKNKDTEYFKYPGEDHNFNGGTWETLATRTVSFYNQQFAN